MRAPHKSAASVASFLDSHFPKLGLDVPSLSLYQARNGFTRENVPGSDAESGSLAAIRKMWMPTFANVFMSHDGYLIDKWEQYLGIYESEIAPLLAAGQPISLLEIGVQNGGSLQVWKKYLPAGSRIVGIDINPDCLQLKLDENTSLHIADGTDQTALDSVLGDLTFDIIIDDGSHRSDHIISTYKALFPRIKGGGKYIVEDLHASYWSEYGGGFRTKGSAMEFFKGLVDGLNCDHFRDTGITPKAEIDHLRDVGRSIARMTFYDSVMVMEFMNVPRDSTYRQIFSGGEAPVVPLSTLFFVGSRPSADTRLVGRTAARHVDQMLLGQISELSTGLAIPGSSPAGTSLAAENRALRAELAAMKGCTSWRVTAPIRKLGRLLGKS